MKRGERSPHFKVDRFSDEMVDRLFALKFTSAEIMVLDTAIDAAGLSNPQMAAKLFVTTKTIKFHLSNIYKKMQLEGSRGTYKKTLMIVRIKDIMAANDFKLVR